MGKKQHQKDKMYLTTTEWTTLYGGKRSGPPVGEKASFRRLPFDHCCLSLQPFQHPVCTEEGHIFDFMAVIPFIKKYKSCPVTGKPLNSKSLIRLNMTKNHEGKYHCPVLYKIFSNTSYIVANKLTGNVFSHEAVEQLNIKTKNWKDLLTDEPFSRKHLIILQNPDNLDKFNISTFHHVKNNLAIVDEEVERARHDASARLKTVSVETRDILDKLQKEYKAPESSTEEKKKADKLNAAHYSTGDVAAGFTSTVAEPQTSQSAAIIDEDVLKYDRVKKKGYVRIVTNFGPINLELHCDLIPKTCENFMKLCQQQYYDGTKFHRSIRHFMIQGGDPTSTGNGGQSIWGKPFKDEIRASLSHTGRGILSMANSGPNTNKSQFFLTYRSCKHLDGKHTVFGRVVGGMDTLTAVEQIETDNKDRPIEDVIFERAQVFVDPFQEAEEQLAKEREDEKKKEAEKEAKQVEPQKKEAQELKIYRKGVGKYVNIQATSLRKTDLEEPLIKKKKTASYKFGSFSSW